MRPLASEINASCPEPEAAGVPARRPHERSWDGDAITHRVTLGYVLFIPHDPSAGRSGYRAMSPRRQPPRPLRSSPHPPLTAHPGRLPVPDPVSTRDELSVAR